MCPTIPTPDEIEKLSAQKIFERIWNDAKRIRELESAITEANFVVQKLLEDINRLQDKMRIQANKRIPAK